MPKATDIPSSTRKLVYERDAFRCRWCGATNQGLEIHHIVYRSQGGGHHAPEILISLCPLHHQLAHSDKSRYMPILFLCLERGVGVTGSQLLLEVERREREDYGRASV